MNFDLPKNVRFILDRFNDAGYAAYVVGGPTRDLLRGVMPSDYDVTTNAKPDEIKALFSDIKTVDTGIKHGTVTLVIGGEPYEVTTYRIDGEYLDARHPSGVEFTDRLELDLLRRDFTMNAIAYNPRVGLVDTTSGISDIENRVIRCVGEAHLRFSEDALRILRALRFSATLGFEIEERTAEAIFALKANLDLVSRERIYTELKKMLAGSYLPSVIRSFMPVLSHIIPEWEGINDPCSIKFTSDFTVNLVSLFALAGVDGKTFEGRMRELRADNATVNLGASALDAQRRFSFNKKEDFIALSLALGQEYARAACRVAIAIGTADVSAYDTLEDILSKTPITLKQLDISGDDLVSLGYRGAEIKKTLNALLADVAYGRTKNEKNTLLGVAKEAKDNIM